MKSSPSLPAAPDPYAVASAQGAVNESTARLSQKLNLIDQNTPLGNVSYVQNPSDADRWSANVNLTPSGQQSFDLQQQVAKSLNNLALQGTGQVQNTLGSPLDASGLPKTKYGLDLPAFDTSGLPKGPTSLDLSRLGATPQFDNAAMNKAIDAAYALNTSKLDPQFEQDRTKLEDRLINSGLAKGTPGYDQEVGNFDRSKASAYDNARNASIGQGLTYGTNLFNTQLAGRQQAAGEAQAQFGANSNAAQNALSQALATRGEAAQEAQVGAGLSNAGRQQDFQQMAYLRSLPLNEVGALLGTGQVQMPSFSPPPSTSINPANLQSAIYSSADLANQNYQAQLKNNASSLGGLFDLGGSLGAAGITASDARMKHVIARVGSTRLGIPIYIFSYRGTGTLNIGVMAQDVLPIIPEAVIVGPNGIMSVNYSMVV